MMLRRVALGSAILGGSLIAGCVGAPSWSPDGTKIAFVRESAIHVVHFDGTGMRRLTRGGGEEYDPAWSPDGMRIAFVRDGDIVVMDADGSGERVLTGGRTEEMSPAWSPDGTCIAFSCHGHIYVMDPDGGHRKRLTTHPDDDFLPCWAPDGQKIAFTRLPDDEEGEEQAEERGQYGVYVMNADGSGQTLLIEGGTWASWSPDGERIAFAFGPSEERHIFNAQADGIQRVQLTEGPYDDVAPSWSPDGTKIAFVRDSATEEDDASGLWVMDADGTNPRRVAEP